METMAATDDAARFADWVGPSLLAMTRLARRLAPHADPDDVVQDALVQAWQKWDQFDPTLGTPSNWLLAITADRARDARRKRVRRLHVVDETALAPDAAAPASNVAADLDLDQAIGKLAGRQRLAVELHYFVGLSVGETATVMGCAVGTVKSTLSDARARLRQVLGDDDEQ
ncbi:MAG: RNA polymerase sigma factor [Pseudonocardiales bacterium]|nr:MAG: RNA polymerase sigma factor [Pseudonocardiales bacterium]